MGRKLVTGDESVRSRFQILKALIFYAKELRTKLVAQRISTWMNHLWALRIQFPRP